METKVNTARTARTARKIKKTVVFMVFDLIMVFLLTWIFFTYIHPSEHPMKESAGYTVFITLCFSVYYFAFEQGWKYLKHSKIGSIVE
jgi:NADH:ubiquinone oxidoreductase subunit 3 (subunit A)